MTRAIWTSVFVSLLLWPAEVQVHAGESPWDGLFQGGVIVDRPPLNTGGFASDTAFVGGTTWQRVVDDVLLSAAQTVDPIRRINWWGFYNENNPPITETMRIRFYGARSGDGLPDDNNIIFEESFLNPLRTATGRQVAVGVGPDELMFHVDLSMPLHLTPDAPYWLEIAQIGGIDTRFRWEVSGLGPIGVAFVNPVVVDWGIAQDIDNAFQLSTIPEPASFTLFLIAALIIGHSMTINARTRRRSKT